MRSFVTNSRATAWGLLMVAVASLLIGLTSAKTAQAVVLAYEGFDYAPGTLLGQDGGTGFAGAWDEAQGENLDTDVEAGSLQYTDSMGNVLVTTGGKMNNNGSGGTSLPGRDLDFYRHGADLGATEANPVFTYISFLGIRQGGVNPEGGNDEEGTYGRGANMSLFDQTCIDCQAGAFERFNFGENSG